MSDSNKPDLARGWQRAEKLVDDEADRLAEMSDAEFEREMAKMPDPPRVPSARELLDRAKARGQAQGASAADTSGTKVRALPDRPRKVPLVAWIAAAVAGAVVALRVLWAPVIVSQANDAGPETQQRADGLRRDAFAACDARNWRACEDKLQEAKRLDPAGDADLQVQRRHKEALEGLARDQGSRGGGG